MLLLLLIWLHVGLTQVEPTTGLAVVVVGGGGVVVVLVVVVFVVVNLA